MPLTSDHGVDGSALATHLATFIDAPAPDVRVVIAGLFGGVA